MKNIEITLQKYIADEGKVFEFKEPPTYEDENGNIVEQKLEAKELYLGVNDSIDNYVEVDANETNPTT